MIGRVFGYEGRDKPLRLDASIVVPTYNRAQSLKRLLESFRSLGCPDSVSVEVLIVDNGSTDETERLLTEERDRSKKFSLRILKEERKGKASALNRGLSSAQGEILFVIDDDVVVRPQWLVNHLECYRTTCFDAVQGRVLPGVDPKGRPADRDRLREYNVPIIDYGDEMIEIRGLTGSNMSFKREVFERVGFFDVRLGPGAAGLARPGARFPVGCFEDRWVPFLVG